MFGKLEVNLYARILWELKWLYTLYVCACVCPTVGVRVLHSTETTIIHDVFVPKQLNYFILSLHFLYKTFIKWVYFNAKHTYSHKNRMKWAQVYVCECELLHARFQHFIVTILVTQSVLGLCDRNNESTFNLISFIS